MIEEEKDHSFAPYPELRHSERGLREGRCVSEESEDVQTSIEAYQAKGFNPIAGALIEEHLATDSSPGRPGLPFALRRSPSD